MFAVVRFRTRVALYYSVQRTQSFMNRFDRHMAGYKHRPTDLLTFSPIGFATVVYRTAIANIATARGVQTKVKEQKSGTSKKEEAARDLPPASTDNTSEIIIHLLLAGRASERASSSSLARSLSRFYCRRRRGLSGYLLSIRPFRVLTTRFLAASKRTFLRKEGRKERSRKGVTFPPNLLLAGTKKREWKMAALLPVRNWPH